MIESCYKPPPHPPPLRREGINQNITEATHEIKIRSCWELRQMAGASRPLIGVLRVASV